MAASQKSPKKNAPEASIHRGSTSASPTDTGVRTGSNRRDGLGPYITSPETFPRSRVLSYDEDFVLIHDMYPKATLHLLLLPRSPRITKVHPVAVLSDTTNKEYRVFTLLLREKLAALEPVLEAECIRLFGRLSSSSPAKSSHPQTSTQASLSHTTTTDQSDAPHAQIETLSPALPRTWVSTLRIGVHARPSMNHFHLHIVSQDLCSPHLRTKKHYNSFATPFLVRVIHPAIGPGSSLVSSTLNDAVETPFVPVRAELYTDAALEAWLKCDLVCFRCRQTCKNVPALKAHLEDCWTRYLESITRKDS